MLLLGELLEWCDGSKVRLKHRMQGLSHQDFSGSMTGPVWISQKTEHKEIKDIFSSQKKSKKPKPAHWAMVLNPYKHIYLDPARAGSCWTKPCF